MTAPIHIVCRRPLDEAAPPGCTSPLDHEPDQAELELIRQDEEAHRQNQTDEALAERLDAYRQAYLGGES